MGIYSHLTDAELAARRDRHLDALEARLTGPSGTGWADKRTQYSDRSPEELRAALAEITAEIDRRAGRNQPRPIILV